MTRADVTLSSPFSAYGRRGASGLGSRSALERNTDEPTPVPARRHVARRITGHPRPFGTPPARPDPRAGPTAHALRRAERRRHRRARGHLERHRPPRAHDRGVGDHGALQQPPARGGPGGPAGDGSQREGHPHRPPRGAGHLLSRLLRRPRRSDHREPPPHRTPEDAAGRRPRRDLRLVRGHGRTGLGHQSRVGRNEDLRRDAPPATRLFRPLRRHDLRRWPPPGRSGTPRRRRVAESRDPGEGQGGRDPRRVPG
jgi:hypothetical protein